MPRKIIIHNHLPVRDHWYASGRANGYELLQGAGVNGGDWGLRLGTKIVTFPSKEAAISHAEDLPERSGKRDPYARDGETATAEPSQFGGYRPILKRDGRTIYAGQAQYTTHAKAAANAQSYADQLARGIREPKVPHKGDWPARDADDYRWVRLSKEDYDKIKLGDVKKFDDRKGEVVEKSPHRVAIKVKFKT